MPRAEPHFSSPPSRLFNVFHVTQIAPGTFLGDLMGFDFISIEPNSVSEIHRHNFSDNVIFVTHGRAVLILNGVEYEATPLMRVEIPRGVWHGFRTGSERFEFVSAQIPPILSLPDGKFDREILV